MFSFLSRMSIPLKSIFILTLFLAFSFSSPVFAQTDDGLRLITSPLPISLSGEPGTSVATDLKVKNGGTTTETLKVSIMKFKAYESSGKPQLMERGDGDSYFDWVRFSEPTFTLAPNEWKTITATFDIPREAAFGYYYAFVFSRAEVEAPLAEKQTAIVGGTAVLVLLEAAVPDAKRQVEVAEFSLDHTFYEFLPATFTVKLKNTGNVHIAPRGNIFIDRGSTKDIAILEINREKGSILPESYRDFQTVWNDGFPLYTDVVEDGKVALDEAGHPKQTLAWDWNNASKLRFGKYTAKMLLIYDDGERDVPIEGEVSFWVVPWRLIGGGGVMLLFAFVGLRSTLFSLWRRIRKGDTVAS